MNMKFVAYFLALTLSLFCFWVIIESMDKSNRVKQEPNYSKGTPAFDLMLLTNEQVVTIGGGQKVAVIGTDVFYLWLGMADNKEIVSITSFNRGVQGSTSSFVVVYKEK